MLIVLTVRVCYGITFSDRVTFFKSVAIFHLVFVVVVGVPTQRSIFMKKRGLLMWCYIAINYIGEKTFK